MKAYQEIPLGQLSYWKEDILVFVAALLVALLLSGCDGEYERLQAEADWNAKMSRAATPKKGELVTIRQYADGRFVVRKYQAGLKETITIARDQ